MEIEELLVKKKDLQSALLTFIENDDDQENYEELEKLITLSNILNNKQGLEDFLYMILHITNNHKRGYLFFNKLIRILKFCQPNIQKYFISFEIYSIFKTNKLMILLLIKNKLILPSEDLINLIFKSDDNISKYQTVKMPNSHFLYFSIKQYITKDIQEHIESEITEKYQVDLETFQENCEKGENDSNICKFIREDLIDDFVVYVSRTKCSLNSRINDSIYETNDFLRANRPSLIEYAAFFGSI